MGCNCKRIQVIVDTREKEPYGFDDSKFDVIQKALPAGDYSLAGRENQIAIERKSLIDYVHTLIQGRDRFKKELQKLRTMPGSCIVVEGCIDDLHRGIYRSGASPRSLIGSTMSIIVDYGIPVFFCTNRQYARLFVQDYLVRYARR